MEEGGRCSVEADAATYTSSFLLHFFNSMEPVTVREYLCGEYASILTDPGARFQLRWMQRYTSNHSADVATWYLDNIRIRIWNRNCFRTVLSQDFYFMPNHKVYRVRLGGIGDGGCGNAALLFNDADNEDSKIWRRSLVIVPSKCACDQSSTSTV